MSARPRSKSVEAKFSAVQAELAVAREAEAELSAEEAKLLGRLWGCTITEMLSAGAKEDRLRLLDVKTMQGLLQGSIMKLEKANGG